MVLPTSTKQQHTIIRTSRLEGCHNKRRHNSWIAIALQEQNRNHSWIAIALHEQNQNHFWIVIALHEQNQNHSWIVIALHEQNRTHFMNKIETNYMDSYCTS